jgi:outer membrane protein OmpA-like peptidoglycan-associated protein
MPSTRRGSNLESSVLLGGACVLLLAACATKEPPPAPPAATPSLFVLLPEPSGGPGQITITTPSGTQVLTQSRQASTVPGAGAAPSAPVILEEADIQRLFGSTLATLPPEPVPFVLHFKGNSDELTPESLALLPQFFRAVQDRAPADISIVGHTDTMGDRTYNYELGLRRANRVADLLVAQGADRNTLDIDSHGEDHPLVKTGDQVAEPRNRRVEIIVR